MLLKLELEIRKRGISLRINDTFYQLYWIAYSPGYINRYDRYRKSKRFQFLTFKINKTKDNLMNDQIKRDVAGVDQTPNYTADELRRRSAKQDAVEADLGRKGDGSKEKGPKAGDDTVEIPGTQQK